MKINLLFISSLMIAGLSCKKELPSTEPPIEKLQTESVIGPAPPICFGNSWINANTYASFSLSFTYNDKIYVPDGDMHLMHIYDGTNWTSIHSDMPLYTTGEWNAYNYREVIFFTIGDKGYISIPDMPTKFDQELWEYNFTTNVWTRRANFPGPRRDGMSCFSIGGKGYVVAGFDASDVTPPLLSDTWQYDQASNTWTKKASLGFAAREGAAAFSVGGKGYLICGATNSFSTGNPGFVRQLLEYNPSSNTWTQKATFPGAKRYEASAFVIGSKAYAGGGYDENDNPFEDFYQYNPSTDSWAAIAPLSNLLAIATFYGFTINSTGYCVASLGGTNYIYKYNPLVCTP